MGELCFRLSSLELFLGCLQIISSGYLEVIFLSSLEYCVSGYWKEICGSSCSQLFSKIGVLKIFYNIHRKKPAVESLFHKVAGLEVCDLIRKRFQHRCFPVNIAKFLRTAFFTERLVSGCFWICRKYWKYTGSLSKHILFVNSEQSWKTINEYSIIKSCKI